MIDTFFLRVVNRLGEANTTIVLTLPITITADAGQTRIVDAQGRDYAFFPDGSFRGTQVTTKQPTKRESGLPCGCDPGANWICEQHRT